MTDTVVKEADAAGSWRLGETTVNRVGLGVMRLSRNGRAFDAASGPRDRRSAIRTLRTALHQGPHVLTIPGTGNPDHLADNVAAAALRLSADEVSRLDGLG